MKQASSLVASKRKTSHLFYWCYIFLKSALFQLAEVHKLGALPDLQNKPRNRNKDRRTKTSFWSTEDVIRVKNRNAWSAEQLHDQSQLTGKQKYELVKGSVKVRDMEIGKNNLWMNEFIVVFFSAAPAPMPLSQTYPIQPFESCRCVTVYDSYVWCKPIM